MIGGGSDDNQPDGQPSPSPPPPSAPPQPTTGGLGRRLLGTIRALLPAPAPPAAAAAAANPKIGLGLLLHLRTDHPLLRPTPSASASASPSASASQDAAAAQPHPAGAAGTRDGACSDGPPSPLSRYRLVDPAAAAAASAAPPSTVSRQFSDLPKPPPPPPAEDNNAPFCARALSKELKVKGAADRQGKDLRAAGQAQEDAVQPRPRDEEATSCHNAASSAKDQDAKHPRDIAVDDQDKGVVSATANGTSGGDRDTHTLKKEKVKLKLPYPQRPGRINCPYYMSKGTCSYGFSCQHHHPQLKAKPDDSWCSSEQGNHGVAASLELNRIGAPIRELKAKPDDNSWRRSEQGNHGVAETLELNRAGLPIREGARNCIHYMRNGACGYGKRCHFNHPEHAVDAQFYAPKGWEEDSALQLEKSSEHHSQRSRVTMKKSSGDATFDDDTSYHKKSSSHATVDDTSYSKKSSEHHTAVDDTSNSKKSSGDATLDDVTSYSKKCFDHATLDDDTSYSKKSSDHATLDDDTSSSSTTGVLPPNIFRMLLPPQKVPASTAAAMVIPVKKDSNWSSASDHSDGCCSADSSDGPLCKQEHNVDSSDRPFSRKQQEHHHVEDSYPERPGRADCPFYMKFGDCKFASACNYHHPKDRYPERPGETECPFYMKNRFCKFGAQCRYNHPSKEDYSNPATALPQSPIMKARKPVPTGRITLEDHMPRLQQQQYPERPGQPECRYYMQFGKCKFLSACRFHHPRRDGQLPAHSDREVGPEIHGMPDCPFYIKSGRCHFGSACEFRHPKDTTTEGASGGHRSGSAYDNSIWWPENAAQQGEEALYPERPGEPECVHYMRHGSCKFQMKCKFHHPAAAVCPAL